MARRDGSLILLAGAAAIGAAAWYVIKKKGYKQTFYEMFGNSEILEVDTQYAGNRIKEAYGYEGEITVVKFRNANAPANDNLQYAIYTADGEYLVVTTPQGLAYFDIREF